ncbi:MAG TPA: right-handed parallel beta-helix repeat-containing protein, partial [Bradyrhizobium sp.]|nr:right-handed parallel beta-helix repeat-containing protein [Bradyrhizobium sp.]
SANNAGTSASAPLASIQAAANLAKPGDTVQVMSGTYDPFTVSTSGTSSAPITFEAAAGATPVINSSGYWNGIDVQASNIVINGFTVEGDAQNYNLSSAMAAYGSGANVQGNGISVDNNGSVAVPNHVVIENNTVTNEPGGGIATVGADYVQILNNNVTNNAHWSGYGNSGISIYESQNSDNNAGAHFVVSGNTVSGNAQMVPTGGVNNTITDGEGIILDSNSGYTGQIMVQNNTVTDNGGPGIESFLTNGATISDNTIYGNNTGHVQAASDSAVFINQSSNNTVTGNITTAPSGSTGSGATGSGSSASSGSSSTGTTTGTGTGTSSGTGSVTDPTGGTTGSGSSASGGSSSTGGTTGTGTGTSSGSSTTGTGTSSGTGSVTDPTGGSTGSGHHHHWTGGGTTGTGTGTSSGGSTVTDPTGGSGTSGGTTTVGTGASGGVTPPTAPAVTVANPALSVSPGQGIDLGVSVTVPNASDNVTVSIKGLPGYETITDKLDNKTFSGSNVTLSAAEVNSGLTLNSSYQGSGQPTSTLTVTATDQTNHSSSAAQSIAVTDPSSTSTTGTSGSGSTGSGSTTTSGSGSSSQGGWSGHRWSGGHSSNVSQWLDSHPGFAKTAKTLSDALSSNSGASSAAGSSTDHTASAGAKAFALFNQMMAGDFGNTSHFTQGGSSSAQNQQQASNLLTRPLH